MDSDGPLYIDESEDRAAKIFKLSTPDVLTQNTTLTSSSVSSSSVDEVCGFNEDGTSCRSVHDTSSLSHLKTPTCDSPSDKISAHDSSLPSTSSSTSDLCDKNIKAVVRFGVIRDHFTCGICHGILVDAFTIVECLHSFCRSCLIHNTYSSASCPTCGYKLDHVTPFKEIKCDRKVQVSSQKKEFFKSNYNRISLLLAFWFCRGSKLVKTSLNSCVYPVWLFLDNYSSRNS